jgi:hypothetical protein
MSNENNQSAAAVEPAEQEGVASPGVFCEAGSPDPWVSPTFSARISQESAEVLRVFIDVQRRIASPWYDTEAAASYLGVSVKQIQRWRGLRKLKEFIPEGMQHPRFRREDLDKLMHEKK